MITLWYSVSGGDCRYSLSYNYIPELEYELEAAAAEAAEDYWNYHDGWEGSWPVEITLYISENGEPIGKLIVEQELKPCFTASMEEEE